MLRYLFRLRALFERLEQQESQLEKHIKSTHRAFTKLKRENRNRETTLQRHTQLIEEHQHLLAEFQQRFAELKTNQQTQVTEEVAPRYPSVAPAQPNMPEEAEQLSFEAFSVIISSLTYDEKRLVQVLWAEARSLSYDQLRVLLGKGSIHAIKKHIHNLQAKGFPLVSERESNGQKFYSLPRSVADYLQKQSEHRSQTKLANRPRNRGH